MDTYDNQKENEGSTVVAEPSAAFGTAILSTPLHVQSPSEMSDGYMTLEQFGELFHQKLDACYADLQSKS